MNSLILENGQKAVFKDFTASRLLLHNKDIRQIKEIKHNNKIVSLQFNEEIEIALGNKITVEINDRELVYNINYIRKHPLNNIYILNEFLDNDSKFFITPILNGTGFYWGYTGYMINTYLDIEHDEKWQFDDENSVIYLLYRFSPSDTFLKIEERIISNKNFLTKYDNLNGDDRFVTYIMKAPDRFMKDIKRFKRGKYKHFSKELKNNIIKFHGLHKDSYISNVLKDSPSLRKEMESELGCSIPKKLSLKTKPTLNNEILCLK